MKTNNILLTIALTLAGIYVLFLTISALQLAKDRNYCEHTKLDQMSSADYQYCLAIGVEK